MDPKTRYKIETFDIEPDRFEIFAPSAHRLEFSRREFFATLGAGILYVISAQDAAGQQPERIAMRLHLAPSGLITVLTGKVDIGQGLRTLLTQAAAEELRVPPHQIRIQTADTAITPDDGGTWASLTTPQTVPVVRRAAAALRQAGFQPQALQQTVASSVTLTDPKDWKILGTSLPTVNGRDIVTGRQQYGSDLKIEGMLHGRILRPPSYNATLTALDTSQATNLPGVRIVRDGTLAGVVAAGESTAAAALALLKPQWKESPLPDPSTLYDHFRKTAEAPVFQKGSRYPALLEAGAVADAMRTAARRHQTTYTAQYIAHAALECRSAIAVWEGRKLTVHCGTQAPQVVRRELAGAFRIPLADVRLIVSTIGAGFGSKHRGECELEAAALARAAGKPVRLAWSREDEFLAGYFRPAALVDVNTAVDANHRITAWDFHNYNSGAAGIAIPYTIPNYYCGFHKSASPLRQGSYRSLAAVANTFARESHLDELAHLASADPLQYRLRHIEDPRLRHVLEEGARLFPWPSRSKGAGLACTIEKDARLALFAQMESPAKVARLLLVFDCGAVLNPDNLRNQLTGALIQGIGGALFEAIRYDTRQVLTHRLSRYRLPRFADLPAIDVHLIDRRDVPPAGAGEAGITLVAPALANAIFSLTAERRRALPLSPSPAFKT
ncbi:MAG: xanthine dehydrogenase family protein molybdopterin-binding subunit [Bryobacterales bacterium]|nr:xanthine dehydrogenase family protein molybdopterin-binding subunit [Bryobacterales bacterium]